MTRIMPTVLPWNWCLLITSTACIQMHSGTLLPWKQTSWNHSRRQSSWMLEKGYIYTCYIHNSTYRTTQYSANFVESLIGPRRSQSSIWKSPGREPGRHFSQDEARIYSSIHPLNPIKLDFSFKVFNLEKRKYLRCHCFYDIIKIHVM